MNFENLNLIQPLLDAVSARGYTAPTPIQKAAIPAVLAGRDVWACAQTGTGKTAAFALPVLQRMHHSSTPSTGKRGWRPIRVLVLAPTRELAGQINESFREYGDKLSLRRATIFGGVNQNRQTRALEQGVDIVAATPGRLLDLMAQGFVDLKHVETFILDEADRMLDMGFIHPIRKIAAALPRKRQTLMFSATMPPAILELAKALLNDPEHICVSPPSSTVDRIRQSVLFAEKPEKINWLLSVLDQDDVKRVLVFTKTKYGADKVVRHLSRYSISAGAIHGNKSQAQRERVLHAFKTGQARVLVATDIAARGLDIDEVSHVVNFELPMDAESYVHRIGRTGRAGSDGVALSFCSSEERSNLRSIERLIQQRLPEETSLQLSANRPMPAPQAPQAPALAFGNRSETHGRGPRPSTSDPRRGNSSRRPSRRRRQSR